MVEEKSISFEREPVVGSAVNLAMMTANGYSIDPQPSIYLGFSSGTYSFIKPAREIGLCLIKTSRVRFERNSSKIIGYGESYDLNFVEPSEESYKDLESKLLKSGIWRRKING